jgi:hypothetical protein
MKWLIINDCAELRWAQARHGGIFNCRRHAPAEQRAKMERYRIWFRRASLHDEEKAPHLTLGKVAYAHIVDHPQIRQFCKQRPLQQLWFMIPEGRAGEIWYG